MSSTTTISSYEAACSRRRWEVPDSDNVVAYAFASFYITGRVWAVSGRGEV